mmetsp:Transcript_11876/g.30043  ORF Transcript_11876/g.30043 Transcript_11876/m.30043 type:complete len:350 (+) Transcript_11876:184-1233(+)
MRTLRGLCASADSQAALLLPRLHHCGRGNRAPAHLHHHRLRALQRRRPVVDGRQRRTARRLHEDAVVLRKGEARGHRLRVGAHPRRHPGRVLQAVVQQLLDGVRAAQALGQAGDALQVDLLPGRDAERQGVGALRLARHAQHLLRPAHLRQALQDAQQQAAAAHRRHHRAGRPAAERLVDLMHHRGVAGPEVGLVKGVDEHAAGAGGDALRLHVGLAPLRPCHLDVRAVAPEAGVDEGGRRLGQHHRHRQADLLPGVRSSQARVAAGGGHQLRRAALQRPLARIAHAAQLEGARRLQRVHLDPHRPAQRVAERDRLEEGGVLVQLLGGARRCGGRHLRCHPAGRGARPE